MDVAQPTCQQDRKQRAHQLATMKFQNAPDWVAFYREVLGVDGVIDQLFPSFEQRTVFEKTAEYGEIQQQLAQLRERRGGQNQPDEPTRVITVRLPQSLHEFLRDEAHNHRTSMNKLCISKLLQVIADELVPSDFQRREEAPSRKSAPHQAGPHPATPQAQSIDIRSGQSTFAAPQPSPYTPAPATQPPAPESQFPRPSSPGGRPF